LLLSPGRRKWPLARIARLLLMRCCSGGIGQATARLLASRGINIAVHYHTKRDVAIALVAELSSLGVHAAAFRADLGDYDAVRKMHAEVVQTLGHPDILYHNGARAGTMLGIQGTIDGVGLEEFESTWRVNSGSAYLVSGRDRSSNLVANGRGLLSS